MRKYVKQISILLCLLMIVTIFANPVPAQAFDKKSAKKNVTVSYKRFSDGILAVYKNKNSFAVTLSGTLSFKDAEGKSLSKETQKNLCLTKKSTATFFFKTPLDGSGNPMIYDSYKGSYSVGQSKFKSRTSKINIATTLQPIQTDIAAINLSGKKLTNINVTFVFYDANDTALMCKSKYLNCYDINQVDQFSISYAGEHRTPSKVKTYINWAY